MSKSTSNLRSWWSKRSNAGQPSARAIARAAGFASDASFETLESRVLLSDPGSTFDTAELLTLDSNGQATFDDKLPDTNDIDMYKFSVTSPDFITLLADAFNAGDAVDDRVDTQLKLYDYNGTLLQTSTGSGTLTGGTPTEAWIGFVPTSSQKDPSTGLYTYFVAASAENGPTNGAQGLYTMRVDAQTTEITHNGGNNEKNTNGSLSRPLEDVVYRLTTGSDSAFDSLATANLKADSNDLDTRLDIYDSTGTLIIGDSQSGRLTNAFAPFKASPDTTYYFRVRSDEFKSGTPRTGSYTLGLDMVAKAIDLDPVTRQGLASGDSAGDDKTELYQFIPQASGDAIASATGAGMIPLTDAALTLYDSNGDFVQFSDRFFGDDPQLESILVGGDTYYILVDGFDVSFTGTFNLFIEANHTYDPNVPLDDHANSLDFAHATPIVWSDWQQASENSLGSLAQGPLVDHSLVSTGTFTGRIHTGSDTDVFVFVPPVDMLGGYTGNIGGEIDQDMDGQTDVNGDAARDGAAIPWNETYRPSTRVEIQVQAVEDPGLPDFTWADMLVRVYDSNGDIVYGQAAPNDSTFSPALYFPSLNDPAGSLDPARYYADLDPSIGIDYTGGATPFNGVFSLEVWGGEPYYIEVSAASGTGRYNAFVAVDGFPNPADSSNYSDITSDSPISDDTFTGIADDTGTHIVSGFTETPNNFNNSPSDFANASVIDLGVNSGGYTGPSGNTGFDVIGDNSAFLERTYVSGDADFPTLWTLAAAVPGLISDPNGATLLAGFDQSDTLFGAPFDNTGVTILQQSGLAGIEHPLDNDLYTFRAAATGYAEIRINTTQLNDWFDEWIADGEGPLVGSQADDKGISVDSDTGDLTFDLVQPQHNTKTKTYNSILDSALRIFSNDFEQIAYNNDNLAMKGETETTNAGNQGTRTFHRRDARVTFPIVKGEIYYVQVESGQADAYRAWQSDPTQPVQWQNMIGSYEMLIHTVPTINNDDYPDVIGDNATVIGIDESTGEGTISGEIDNNTSNNNFDVDAFTFIAPKSGDFTVTASRQSGETLIPDIEIFRVTSNGGLENVAGGAASSEGSITINLTASKGERYYVTVVGAGTTEGLYTLDLAGFDVVDDHADFADIQNATPIELFDFLGSASATGTIESNGDTDVFSFTTGDFTDATITVSGTSNNFNPEIDVYEVSLDPSGNPILLRIATNDDLNSDTTDARVTIGLTPDRISGDTGLEYPNYYLVVKGSDVDNDEGDYQIDFSIDKTDDHADQGQFEFATPFAVDDETGQASETGTIEIQSDTDLFRFTALAAGTATVTISRPSDSDFLPKLTIMDADGNALDTPSDGSIPGIVEATVTRGQVYYVLVEKSSLATSDQSTGDYTLTVVTPPLDDYPNAGEFSIAASLVLDPTTGDHVLGTTTPGDPLNPAIDVVRDTDLFTFISIAQGNITVTFSPLDTSSIGLKPELTIYDSDLNQVQQVTATNAGDTVSIVLSNVDINTRFYVLVGDALGNRTGEYQLTIDGNGADDNGGGGGGGTNGEVDFGNATEIDLDPFNADGSANGVISQAGERDLYTFTAPASGTIYVQVTTPTGTLLDASVTVLDAATETAVVTNDATGIPGVDANVSFQSSGAGTQYWVIVDGVGTGVGSYKIRIDAEPEVYRVFYPEGFTGPTIREFVSLANPNNFDITYSVILHYEVGERDQTIVSNATLAAGSRGGVTISNAQAGSPVGARIEPYAVEVRAIGGPIGATMSHYDFGASTGDAFTNVISPVWDFARIERNPGSVNDFLVYYNPHDFDVTITLTAYDSNGDTSEVSVTIGAQRRGGLNLNDHTNLPTGIFGGIVTAKAADSANDSAFQGIVAALTHFDLVDTSGFGFIGDATGGSLAGAVPSLTQGDAVDSELVLFNPNPFITTVTLNGKYSRADLPDLNKIYTIPAGSQLVLSGTDLGLIKNQPIGIRYNSDLPITILGSQSQFGDADATGGSLEAGTGFFFGDAFINTALAGQSYLETLSVYNPTNVSAEITIDLLFVDGTNDTLKINVGAGQFSQVELHNTLGSDFEDNTNRPDDFDPNAVLGRTGLNFFSIFVSAPTPFVVDFTHYDLFLQGGWTNGGAALGLLNPISAIA